ncbi:MAG: UvrD-helicase domain-containing protein [Planctomycetes bacterium]|nr:UvrD-helicase domain-containing protein [Planctomycetota bacterium]
MNTRVHELVLASAGTGKTYQLSLRYVDLLFQGVPPERILATTFTRKAAGEILERILERLCDAVEKPEKLAELRRALPGREVTRERALTLLGRLVKHVERLRVSTIDAFFAGVARAYALDLGLPPAWRIVDEETDEELQADALAKAFTDAPRAALLALLADLQRQAASSSVHRALFQAVHAGLEHFVESDASAWETIDVPPAPAAEEVEAAIAVVERTPCPQTKSKPIRNVVAWDNELKRLPPLLRSRDWAEAFAKGLPKKIAEGAADYSSHAIPPETVAALQTILRQAVHESVDTLVRENVATRALLERFSTALATLRRERGSLRFSDLPLAIAPPKENPFSARSLDLAWRLDGKIDHLLLDEFQDTAPLQWRCLAPIADELLADGTGARSFFCVGDEKQSIYGWRGGEPELLVSMNERYPVLDEPTVLSKSWRSSQVILDVVNGVFTQVAANAVFADQEAGRKRAASTFEERYPQHTAAKELPGAAFLLETNAPDKDADEKPDDLLVALTIERITALHAAEPRATIAVLLRRKQWVPRLILGLAKKGLRASGEGGNPLTDGTAVLEILSLLHLADHPEDETAAFHVARSSFARIASALHPRGEELGAAASGSSAGTENASAAESESGAAESSRDNELSPERRRELEERALLRADMREAVRTARAARRAIASRGYGRWLADVHARLVASKDYGDWDLRRAGQLVELGLAFDATPTARTGEFVRHTRRTRVEDESAARIKIMTVHASKGLEFDAVLLPDLHKRMTGRPNPYVWKRDDPAGAITAVSRRLGKGYATHHPALKALNEYADQRQIEGELSVLYVALTRAKHRMELLVPHRDPDAEAKLDCACVLRHALGNTPTGEKLGSASILWRHERNAERWLPAEERGEKAEAKGVSAGSKSDAKPAAPPAATSAAPASPPTPTRLNLAPSKRARGIETKSASAEEHGPVLRAAELLRPIDPAASQRGTLVHRFLAEIEWLDTPLPPDERLRELARTLEHDEERITNALAEFHAALARPAIQALLTRPKTTDELVVWRERPFALHLADDHGVEHLWRGAFDRVVLARRAGGFTSADLLDWKTDHASGDELTQRIATYRPQLAAYRRAVARITSLDERAITARLAFLHAGECVECR